MSVIATPHVFDYGDRPIRVFDLADRRVAVAADICAVLGIKKTSDAIANLDEDDYITISRPDTTDSNDSIWQQMDRRVQRVTLVTEDGAADLILQSRKPEARAFRRWLTHEVWASIRQTGSYSIVPAPPPLKGKELMAAALVEAQNILAARETRIAELEPKAEYHDRYMSGEGCYDLMTAADILGVGRTTFTNRLRAAKIFQKGKPMPYAEFLPHFNVEERTRIDHHGRERPYIVVLVRHTSIEWLRNKLGLS